MVALTTIPQKDTSAFLVKVLSNQKQQEPILPRGLPARLSWIFATKGGTVVSLPLNFEARFYKQKTYIYAYNSRLRNIFGC
jgi:hypothetical protein